jgi:hypothetical protein
MYVVASSLEYSIKQCRKNCYSFAHIEKFRYLGMTIVIAFMKRLRAD